MTPPPVVRIRQHFPRPQVIDIAGTVRSALAGSRVPLAPGWRVAIAVGSRGVANLATIVRATVEHVRAAGAAPFIVPAMGSHGGATASGQCEVLASYGVTAGAMGCAVESSMEVVTLPADGLENALHMDRHAWGADGVILINRIKPHTDFHGAYESGLVKMAVIGLGKERQAYEMHRFGVRGLRDLIPLSARHILATGKILLGLAVVENAADETGHVEAVPGADIMRREPELLEMARANMPRLPVDDLDLLVVDRLGKNISGSGMDTNIIGRVRIAGEAEPAAPRVRSIVVTDLTPESHGNATGIGLADVITRRLFARIDFPATYTNIITSGFLERGKLPVVTETAREAVELALRAAGCREPAVARIARIRDTLHLGDLWVSLPVGEELRGRPGIEFLGEAGPLWTPAGELCP